MLFPTNERGGRLQENIKELEAASSSSAAASTNNTVASSAARSPIQDAYITEDEFLTVSKVTRNRVTLGQINEALGKFSRDFHIHEYNKYFDYFDYFIIIIYF